MFVHLLTSTLFLTTYSLLDGTRKPGLELGARFSPGGWVHTRMGARLSPGGQVLTREPKHTDSPEKAWLRKTLQHATEPQLALIFWILHLPELNQTHRPISFRVSPTLQTSLKEKSKQTCKTREVFK